MIEKNGGNLTAFVAARKIKMLATIVSSDCRPACKPKEAFSKRTCIWIMIQWIYAFIMIQT